MQKFNRRPPIDIRDFFCLILWSQDVSQANLQAAEKLMRNVHVKVPGKFQLGPGQVIKLLKYTYGPTYAGDYWHHKITINIRGELVMVI